MRVQSRALTLELRRETAIRDDQISLATDQQHRRIAGETSQVAHVGDRAHEKRVDLRGLPSRSEPVPARLILIHARSPVAAATAPVAAATAAPVATTTPVAAAYIAAAAVIPCGAAAGIVVGADDGVAALVGSRAESGA